MKVGGSFMEKSKLHHFLFTVAMAFIMVYAMICYNISLNIGGMTNAVFVMAFHHVAYSNYFRVMFCRKNSS